MNHKIKKLILLLTLTSIVAIIFSIQAQDKPKKDDKDSKKPFTEITPEARNAIDRALEYLAKSQSKDGSFGGGVATASTSMACLAFIAAGHTPGRGKYGDNVERGLRYILRCTSKSGFITGAGGDGSGMHGHGFATLFLAEISGMVQKPELAEEVRIALRKAVKGLEKWQNKFGGWNGTPDGNATDDGSGAIAIMQIAALRAARNAGITISESTIKKAQKYLLDMTTEDGWYAYNYNSRGGGNHSSALTGAGLTMLNALGLQDNPKVKKAVNNLMKSAPFLGNRGDSAWNMSWYYYTCFYASLAIFQEGGECWKKWYPAMRDELIKKQSKDGSWEAHSYGPLWTAFATLTLELPYRLLPYFQEGGRGASGG